MIRGSCLCGVVCYEVRGPLSPAVNCHCSMCRKVHGAAFGTYARVERSDFAILSGTDEVASYQSSPEVTRTFCRRCGSTLQFISSRRPGSFALALGTVDDDPGVRPERHIFVGSKAAWFDITDQLPRYDARP
ncbi:MAG TPA: GFA family protein [Casimicrobiaceae bacterium]|nr:GFA family protein [Casimicrobiaceae bacterium]